MNLLTFDALLGGLVFLFSPLLEFRLKTSQELRGLTMSRSEDTVSWKARGKLNKQVDRDKADQVTYYTQYTNNSVSVVDY